MNKVLKKCLEIANSNAVAVCVYGETAYRFSEETEIVDALIVMKDFKRGIASYGKRVNGFKLNIIALDKELFEKDVKMGFFGEFVSDILLAPYLPLLNHRYLKAAELQTKKRNVKTILENLILELPELCQELLIKPEYFIHEIAYRKTKIFPQIKHSSASFFKEVLKNRNIELVMEGFRLALKELEKEGLVEFSNEYVKIKPSFIDEVKKQKFRIIFKKLQRKVLSTVLELIPKTSGPLIFEEIIPYREFKGSEKYLYISTPMGLVSLKERVSIEDFIPKFFPEYLSFELNEIGGILNSVYLLTIKLKDRSEKRVVVKKFKDWLGLKWFPITLWTLGTKSFAVLGESRLEREYAINKFLQENGFNVPEIIYVSPKEGLIFQEYVDGISLVEIIKEILSGKTENLSRNLKLIEKVGNEMAKIHALNVSLGDSKPENMLIAKDGKVYFVDLEQASRDGNKAWDIAEFLYYSGHYALPTSPLSCVKKLAESFIQGYLNAGGERKAVREAGSARYTKVFSIFALPHITLMISNLCKKLGRE